MNSITTNPERERLAAFVGRWTTEGEVLAGPSTPPIPIRGEDVYEWLPGGYALLHRVDVWMGGERARLVEVIGYDAASGTYAMHSFDEHGNAGTMRATVDDGVWRFTGGTERFTGGFDENGKVLAGRWERSPDGAAWVPWMEIRLTRAELWMDLAARHSHAPMAPADGGDERQGR